MSQSPTLKKISTLLNVSISTVSRALKNHPDISDHTKKKVQDLAEMMDYEPNAAAISLRTNSSNILALIVPSLANHFYISFLSALEEESRKNGFTLIAFQSNDNPDVELENLKLCRINHVAGIFIAISPNTKNIEPYLKLEENGVPVIFFDKVPEQNNCNKVMVADEEAALIAAEKIVKSHKKKVLAVFGNKEMSITKKRWLAFSDYLQKQAPKTELTCIFANSADDASTEIEKQLKKNTPDVIFSMSDDILTGAMKAIRKMKLKVPEQIAVVSISNGFIPQLYDPEITYVETSGFNLGKMAFERLVHFNNGQTTAEELILPCRFVKGKSL
jgi:LacI family transcriptional regulator